MLIVFGYVMIVSDRQRRSIVSISSGPGSRPTDSMDYRFLTDSYTYFYYEPFRKRMV